MLKKLTFITGILLTQLWTGTYADSLKTLRIPLLANKTVNVWKTIIYPENNQALGMHRHENNRVLVALNSGTLKVTNDKGESRYVKLVKDHVYYLSKDVPNELHTDINVSKHPIKVIVVELKS